MASNQIDPAGAPTAQEAERLARLQGLQGEVVSVQEVTLEGEYLVNYRQGDAIRAAMADLHHPAWELVDEAEQAWYIVRVCGNLAVVRPRRSRCRPSVWPGLIRWLQWAMRQSQAAPRVPIR